MSSSPGIAITGVGCVCGAGRTVDSIWNRILSGESVIGPIGQWDAKRWPVGVAAEVNNQELRTLVEDRRLQKMISRTDLFGLYAAGEAILSSGVTAEREK